MLASTKGGREELGKNSEELEERGVIEYRFRFVTKMS
jgi:hypothetical protein